MKKVNSYHSPVSWKPHRTGEQSNEFCFSDVRSRWNSPKGSTISGQRTWKELLFFCIAAYAFSWGVWLAFFPSDLAAPGETVTSVHISAMAIMLAGSLGPTVAAIGMAFIGNGWPGVLTLLRRFQPSPAHLGWFPFALVAFPIADIGTRLIYDLVYPDGVVRDWEKISTLFMVVPFAAVSGALTEELGWRGYFQPALLGEVGVLGTGLIVGIVWTFWHAPLFYAQFGFFISGFDVNALSISACIALLVTVSTLMAWMGSHNESNVFLSYLFHFSMNTAVGSILLVAHSPADQINLLFFAALGLVVVGTVSVSIRYTFMRESNEHRDIERNC